MGNHHLRDVASERSLQNPLEPLTFEVDSAANVSDDVVLWESFGHVVTLSLEIVLLTVR